MNSKVRLTAPRAQIISRLAIFVCLLIGILNGIAIGQRANQTEPKTEPGELYAGVELSADGARAVALRISRNNEEPSVKLVYSEVIHLALGGAGDLAPQATTEAVAAVQKLITRLRQERRVPDERIYLIGSSRFETGQPEGLVAAVNTATGKRLTLLDAATEVQLSIVGTIPQREKDGDAWIDNRNSSALIEIGNYGARGGYQLLRYTPLAPPRYEFITMNIPHGTISFANEVSRAVGDNHSLLTYVQRARALGAASFRQSLQKAREGKPGLLTRKRVYLSGDIVWAMATLLYPEDRETFVPLTAEDVATFAKKAIYDPLALLNPSLSRIRDPELRREVEREMELLKNTFTPQQIAAGAEVLRAASAELDWQEKTLWFARFGHLSRILSYVRLQAEK